MCDLAAVLGLSQSAVSHQLRLLRGIRLVRPRREGRIVFYSLDDQHIISIFKQTLQHVEEKPCGSRVSGARSRRRADGCGRDEPRDRRRPAATTARPSRRNRPARRVRGWFTAIAAVLAIVGCGIGMLLEPAWWVDALLIAATVVGSVFPAQRAWQSMRRRSLDINVLMVIAVVGAMFIGEYEEAAMVVTLFAAAQWLEAQSLDRARKAIGKLIDLAPAEVLIRDGAGERLHATSTASIPAR